jgi:hypothetical protein
MAHFAKLDENNVVIDVNVVNNDDIQNLPFPESEAVGVEFLTNWSGGYSNWKQTSYNANFRKNYAGIGGIYDPIKDAFILPQPYPSWVLNQDTCIWEAPVPRPTGGIAYNWDEETLSWHDVMTVPIPYPDDGGIYIWDIARQEWVIQE